MAYRRTLSRGEKAEYIKAVKCLQSHPALDSVMPEARTRFDEFQAYHIQAADGIHLLVRYYFLALFPCIEYKLRLSRVSFCRGTGTISEAMKKRCAMSADTAAHSRQYCALRTLQLWRTTFHPHFFSYWDWSRDLTGNKS